MLRLLLSVILLTAFACGDSDDAERDGSVDEQPSDASAPDAAGQADASTEADANIAECGEVGTACADGCGEGLICYRGAEEGFCGPARAECGGFAGAQCENPDHVCATLSGSSSGACLSPAELECVCARSPESVESC